MLSCDMASFWCQFWHQAPLAIFAVVMIWLAVKDMGRDKEKDE